MSAAPTTLAGMPLPSPVLVAAGCGGTGRELAAYVDLAALGGFVTRSISLDPRPGAAAPRVVESPSGLVHATGFPNPGVQGFLATELPWLVQQGARVVVSMVAGSLGEYAELARRLGTAPGLAAVEVNLGPADGAGPGVLDVREPVHTGHVVAAVRRELPDGVAVLAKVRPDPLRVVESARAVTDAGAAAVVVGGPLAAALPDGRPAGLGGPAVGPVVARCVAEVCAGLDRAAVVAGGGVATADQARRLLDLGAVAVQVGTAQLHDPTTLARLVAALDPTPDPDTPGGPP
ncbi:tRNA-dihydrouridine synthase [Nocardioides ferulae]|uniref:tRNA-dihydrouridine synthase n=1 Tax=Nocardioides ferulae TaxID=2340821 RepID=UPI000EB4F902|nr:tRNA-dihydrouridine synthase [Nocardioides ferulae]